MNKKTILLIAICVLAAFFRLQNVNWDSNAHLHPDERFLTMVGNAMKLPASFSEYLDPAASPLNPPNIGFPFYVYGTFPIVVNKLIALFLNTDTYTLFVLQGRILSAFADLTLLFFVYKTAELLENKHRTSKHIKFWAAFIYACTVFSIQSSHFFTTDTFLSLFVFLSFYFSLTYYYKTSMKDLIFASIFLGLGIASKVSAVYMAPLIIFFITLPHLRHKKVIQLIYTGLIFGVVTYLTVRICGPYYFQSSDIFNFRLNDVFLKNINDLKIMASGKVWFPPVVQWHSKTPVLFSLFNLVFFGFGIFQFIITLIGLRKKMIFELKIIGAYIVLYFIYNGFQHAQSIRYLLFILPFLSLITAFGLQRTSGRRLMVYAALILVWPVLFSTIYLQKHTRIQASEWIDQNIKNNAIILSEYWDDALPVPLEYSSGKQYQSISMTVFDPDTDDKWTKMNEQLKNADYYILSSNRGWASMPTVPDKYPRMTALYRSLFNGKTSYRLVKQFIPWYQSFFPFHPDSWINNWFEETFTVYDHPSVFVFKNTKKSYDYSR